jgi:hypothetical protein
MTIDTARAAAEAVAREAADAAVVKNRRRLRLFSGNILFDRTYRYHGVPPHVNRGTVTTGA